MVFNPDVGGVPSANMPDQTGASRGSIPNRAGEFLLSGVGDTIKGAANLYNEANHWQIDQAVREGYNKANEPFTDTVPKELENAGSSVSALQNAFEQGKISETYYTGQLVAMSKKLRSQYPLYEDYIDKTIQDVTGIRPANAYRNAVMSELEAQEAEKKSSAKAFDNWVDQNGDWIKTVIPDYFSNPEKYAGQEKFVKDKVFGAQSDALNDINYGRQLEIKAKQNSLTKEEAEQGAIQSLNLVASTYIDGINTASGIMSGRQVQDRLTELAKDGITDEDYAEGMQLINNFELSLRQALTNKFSSPIDPTDPDSMSLSALVNDPSKFDNIMKQAMAPWTAIKEYATNKEWGLFTYYSRMVTLQKDRTVSDLLASSGTLSTINALSEIGGGGLVDSFLSHDGVDRMDSILAEITPELTARTERGYTEDFHDNIDIMLNSDKTNAEKAAGVNAYIDKTLGRIMAPDITPEGLANHVKSVYTRDEKGISLFEKIPAGERETLYRNLFQPAVTDAIVKSGNQELMGLYLQSAMTNTKSIQSLREAAAAVQNGVEWNKNVELTYVPGDPPSIQQKVLGGQGVFGFGVDYSIAKTQTAINSINGVLATLSPVMTGMGADEASKNAMIESYLRMLSIDLGEAKKDNFFDLLIKGVQSGVEAMNESTSDAQNQAKENAKGAPMTPLDDTFSLDPASITPPVGDYGAVANTIIGFEGYRDTAYWDTNTYRTGFGSDTMTAADGTVSKVTKGTKITREDAERDLARRINEEFVPSIIAKVGPEAWSSLSEGTQAALASVTYNYGELPTSVAKAVQSGDVEAIRSAIQDLRGHNGGINRRRRLEEAAMVS